MTTATKKGAKRRNERPYRNIRLSVETHRKLKLIAVKRDIQLQEIVEELLEWALSERNTKEANK